MIKTRTWILLLGGLLLAGLLFLLRPPAEARFAEIWSDGELVCRVSLAEDQSILVESRYGTNTVTVSQGKIAVTNACKPVGKMGGDRSFACRTGWWCSFPSRAKWMPYPVEVECKGRNCAVFFDFWKEEW